MSPNKKQRGMLSASTSASAETEIIRRVTRSEDPLRGKLLWDIRNEVMLERIATRLSWRDCQVVATVSRDWQRALRGRKVYDARVRSQSTEMFFVVCSEVFTALGPKYANVFGETRLKISLFSPREERWYKLPSVPGCHSGMPCECEILDGSMYLLGGTRSGEKHIRVEWIHEVCP